MGCENSKNLEVEPINPNQVNGTSNGDIKRKLSVRRPSEAPTIIGEEPQLEMLDNVNNVQKTMNGLSFDITFEEMEGGEDSIIKKHPPKKFQKLEEQEQVDPNATLQKLQEKLDEADLRRQQILQQRIASAKVRKPLKRQNDANDDDLLQNGFETDEDDSLLKVPAPAE